METFIMKLSVLNRIIILESVLPTSGTITQLKLTRELKKKLALSQDEMNLLKVNGSDNGMLTLEVNDVSILSTSCEYFLSNDELKLLQTLANSINNRGLVTEASLDTIEMLININVYD